MHFCREIITCCWNLLTQTHTHTRHAARRAHLLAELTGWRLRIIFDMPGWVRAGRRHLCLIQTTKNVFVKWICFGFSSLFVSRIKFNESYIRLFVGVIYLMLNCFNGRRTKNKIIDEFITWDNKWSILFLFTTRTIQSTPKIILQQIPLIFLAEKELQIYSSISC